MRRRIKSISASSSSGAMSSCSKPKVARLCFHDPRDETKEKEEMFVATTSLLSLFAPNGLRSHSLRTLKLTSDQVACLSSSSCKWLVAKAATCVTQRCTCGSAPSDPRRCAADVRCGLVNC